MLCQQVIIVQTPKLAQCVLSQFHAEATKFTQPISICNITSNHKQLYMFEDGPDNGVIGCVFLAMKLALLARHACMARAQITVWDTLVSS